MIRPTHVDVNGRRYTFPREPVVVVCIDGSQPEYHERAMAAGRMPYVSSLLDSGEVLSGECVMPSFTNPNNMSIATGVTPAVHGICGNTFLDQQRSVEVMMNDPEFLRAPTIFAAFEAAGAKIAVITAKDKLRRLLGDNLRTGISFSAERADRATIDENRITDVLDLVGLPMPSVYSAELSEFVLAAGARILQTRRPDLMYLTLTDFIQHKYAPGSGEADDFYAMIDSYLAQLDALGATLVVTADHGMNAKHGPDGRPQIVFLQEWLDAQLGGGVARTVLPITDPYVRHHGALGSFALVYGAPRSVADALAAAPGIAEVVPRDEACARFQLPVDRIGDLVVVAEHDHVLGTTVGEHDLAQLDRPLRSHGGLSEQQVPIILNRRLAPLPDGHRLRNIDAYWLALNFAEAVAPAEHAGVPVGRGRGADTPIGRRQT